MKIGVTGVTGFVGSRLAEIARSAGHEIVGFSRSPGAGRRAFSYDCPADCSGLDAVIHLAGEPIMGLWTKEKKERILSSRVEGTRRVVEGFAAADPAPRALVCASAVGIYGPTGDVAATEESPWGSGFLAEVARAWEAEARSAEATGARVTLLRIGFVLGPGGALRMLAPVFRCGLGGPLGSGRQWMSGIHVDDVAGLALRAAETPSLAGPVNAVMPEPFRNADFTAALASAVRRPAIVPVPAWILRAALGGLSSVMLDSCRALPRAALAEGYAFRYPSLDLAIRAALDPASRRSTGRRPLA